MYITYYTVIIHCYSGMCTHCHRTNYKYYCSYYHSCVICWTHYYMCVRDYSIPELRYYCFAMDRECSSAAVIGRCTCQISKSVLLRAVLASHVSCLFATIAYYYHRCFVFKRERDNWMMWCTQYALTAVHSSGDSSRILVIAAQRIPHHLHRARCAKTHVWASFK